MCPTSARARRPTFRSEGVAKACSKRPVSTDVIDKLVDDIERELHTRFENEVPSSEIGECVMNRLRELDKVAFLRFASVYRGFKDVTDFVQEADIVSGKTRRRRKHRPARAQAQETADPSV